MVRASSVAGNESGLEYLNRTGKFPGAGGSASNSVSVVYAPNITVVNEGQSQDSGGGDVAEQIDSMVRQTFEVLLVDETRPGGLLDMVRDKKESF